MTLRNVCMNLILSRQFKLFVFIKCRERYIVRHYSYFRNSPSLTSNRRPKQFLALFVKQQFLYLFLAFKFTSSFFVLPAWFHDLRLSDRQSRISANNTPPLCIYGKSDSKKEKPPRDTCISRGGGKLKRTDQQQPETGSLAK